MINICEFRLPRMATIKETVKFLDESAKKANVKNYLTEHRIRELALSNQIVHLRAGKKILINLDKLIDFLNIGSVSESRNITGGKYGTVSRIEA